MNRPDPIKAELVEKKYSESIMSGYVSNIIYFEKPDIIAAIEEHLKSIKFLDGLEFNELSEVKITGATVGSVEYIQDHHCFAVTGSDKFIYFYDQTKFSLQRRFQMPETQNFLTYYAATDTLFTANVAGKIYAWNMEKIYGDYFMDQIKQKKETYRMVLVEDFPL